MCRKISVALRWGKRGGQNDMGKHVPGDCPMCWRTMTRWERTLSIERRSQQPGQIERELKLNPRSGLHLLGQGES